MRFDLPIVSLCDTPGFMVGPDAEKTAIVRHVARMFVTGASLTVPLFTIVLRKGYGLGAQAMAAAASMRPSSPSPGRPASSAAWASKVTCGSASARRWKRSTIRSSARNFIQAKVASLYENGKAISIASVLEIDDVIDPADTRQWIMAGLRSVPKPPPRTTKKRPCIDAW